ncbi:MAG: sensor histidine kinase [Actinomycetota bacterium]
MADAAEAATEESAGQLPARLGVRAFEAAVTFPVIAGIGWAVWHHPGGTAVPSIVLWIALVAIVDLLPIPAWGGLVVSLSFPILVAASLVYPPAIAGAVALLGSSDVRELRRELRPLKALFIRAQMALAVIIGSALFHAFASMRSAVLLVVVAATAATIACYVVNAVIVAAYTALDTRIGVGTILVEMHGANPLEFLIAYLGLGLYGTLIARFFLHDGAWAVAAFFAPLVLARQMFFRTRALEVATADLRDRERALQEASDRLRDQNAQLEQQAKMLEVHLARERDAVAELRELNRLKSDFVAVASHELRTPLTSIIGYAHSLLLPDVQNDPPLREEFAVGISRQGERLLALVQNLLTASSLEGGSIRIDMQRVVVEDLCREVLEGFGERSGRVRLAFAEGLPVVRTDRTLLGRVLMNLIENALKYSPEDRPCTVVATAQGDAVALEVRDQGLGISEHAQAHIFERFYQADSSSTRRFQGAGLGLAIVKEILEHLGGTIRVSSREGEGTTFIVCVPVDSKAGTEGADTEPADASAPDEAAPASSVELVG